MRLLPLPLLSTLLALALPASAAAASFEVTRSDDPAPDACVPGDCSLREAVRAAAAEPGDDEVELRPGAAYELALAEPSLPGTDGGGAGGDLDVTGGGLRIAPKRGIGPRADEPARIDANGLDRVIEVSAGDSLRLTGVELTGGAAAGAGGAILGRDKVTLTRVTLHASSAAEDGGGLAMLDGTARLKSSTISANAAGRDGGGIDIARDAELRAINSTVAENRAGGGGGGIAAAGPVALNVVTVAYNVADSDLDGAGAGAGLESESAAFVVENSLLANNRLGLGSGSDCAGGFDSDGDNLLRILDPAGCNGFDFAGDLVSARNPRIGKLADNGGPTKTIALRPGSRALDEGGVRSSPRRDQRNVRRDELPDIGAYEREGEPER